MPGPFYDGCQKRGTGIATAAQGDKGMHQGAGQVGGGGGGHEAIASSSCLFKGVKLTSLGNAAKWTEADMRTGLWSGFT